MNDDTLWRLRNARSALNQARRRMQRVLLAPDAGGLSGQERARLQRAVWDAEKALEELAWVLPTGDSGEAS